MEQMEFNLILRWFVGLGIDDASSRTTDPVYRIGDGRSECPV